MTIERDSLYHIPGTVACFSDDQGNIYQWKEGKLIEKKATRFMKNGNGKARLCITLPGLGKNTKARYVLAAKLGRPLLKGIEYACHVNGQCDDDRFENLEVRDQVGNALDDLFNGSKETTIEHIEANLTRLINLRDQYLDK